MNGHTDIIVTGSLGFDYIMSFEGRFTDILTPQWLDRISLDILVNTFHPKLRAGCAGNIAYNLALLKLPPLLVGAAGGDYVEALSHFSELGIDVSGVKIFEKEASAAMFATVDKDGHQFTCVYSGAMAYADTLVLSSFLKHESQLIIIAPNLPAAMLNHVADAKIHRTSFIFAPGQQVPNLSKEDIVNGVTGAKALVLNGYELELVKKKTGLSVPSLLRLAEIIAVTLDKDGSVIYSDNDEVRVPAVRPNTLTSIDPTGCGDAYVAAFAFGLANGFPLYATGCVSALAATYVLESPGAQNHSYTLANFSGRLRESFPDMPELPPLR